MHEAVGLVDLFPTLVDAMGLPTPDGLSGRSLRPLVSGASREGWAVGGSDRGVRFAVADRYKLVRRTVEGSVEVRLHDVLVDPSETKDLLQRRPVTASYLRDLLAREDPGGGVMPPAASPAPVDPDTAAQLRALGYVDR